MSDYWPCIGLTGAKGSGKSTLGRYLERRHGYEVKAYAMAVRREMYEAIGQHVLRSLGHTVSFDHWLWFVETHKHCGPSSGFGWIRPMMQFWGTEFRRKGDPDYWVQQVALGSRIVVDDVSFENERLAIKDAGGIMIRLERKGANTTDPHPSEVNRRTMQVDYIIENDDSIVDLARSMETILTERRGPEVWRIGNPWMDQQIASLLDRTA